MQLGNALNGFEIPVSDFERGKKNYETIFNYQMPENTMGNIRMGFFLYDFQNGKVVAVPSVKVKCIHLHRKEAWSI